MKEMLAKIIKLAMDYLNKQQIKPIVVEVTPPAPAVPTLDWSNPESKVSMYFTVKNVLYLPTWKRMANEADGLNDQIKANLIDLCKSMDMVVKHFGKAPRVHVTYRPLEYNKAIGGALHSAHSEGAAMDFDLVGLTCDEVRKELVEKNLLETWGMRCEDAPGTNWVHLDRRTPPAGGHRFFKP